MTWDQKGDFPVRIKARDLVHEYIYHYHPLDIVGWDGCYYPFVFNADDFSPITGKLHMPPPIHQTFETDAFVFAPDLLLQKVWRSGSAGLMRTPAQGSCDRTVTKFAGLTASMGFIGLLYWLFPEYTTNSPFYQHFWALIKVLVPVMLALAVPYLYLVDRRMEQPEDNLWHLGRFVLLQWDGIDGPAVGQQLLGWVVKGFFLPHFHKQSLWMDQVLFIPSQKP